MMVHDAPTVYLDTTRMSATTTEIDRVFSDVTVDMLVKLTAGKRSRMKMVERY